LNARDHLCFALDYPTLREAHAGAERVAAHVGVFKVGLELFMSSGKEAVSVVQTLGRRVFLDLKLHDIPETVERAVAVAADLQVDYLTVHAAGGARMLEASARRLSQENSKLKLLAVTVLTSLSEAEARALGFGEAVAARARRFARLAVDSGLRGVVCSVEEAAALRAEFGDELFLVTPGIRTAADEHGDQTRVGTPSAAIRCGADLLVVGRPIRDARDPLIAAAHFENEIRAALGERPAS
jgi:orotidine-5'-phosphate decarboxylase